MGLVRNRGRKTQAQQGFSATNNDAESRGMDEHVAGLEDPRSAGKALTGPLGTYWRYSVGDYRVICEIKDDVVTVLMLRIGHRCDVYE